MKIIVANNFMKILGTIIGVIMLLMSGSIGWLIHQEKPMGSVGQGGEYKYTQLTGAVATTSTAIKSGVGTLGSVVITADSASGAVVIYDATSTAALSGSSALYSRIADLEDGLVEGVYTFDVSFYNGLVLDTTNWAAFAGDWTVTHR